MDLDVDTPEKVAPILREAGKVWSKIAKILERAANQIDKVV